MDEEWTQVPSKKKKEACVVAIDRSASMLTPLSEAVLNYVPGALQQRCRMDAVKQMFYTFRDRCDSLNSDSQEIQLGLIAYDDTIEKILDLTPDLDKFEALIDDIKTRGQTAIFSAISKGIEMLSSNDIEFKRVIALTDGQNNCGALAQTVLNLAISSKVVIDAIIVGMKPDHELLRLAYATGGEIYFVQSLSDGFELLEQEDVASLIKRHDGEHVPVRATALNQVPSVLPMLEALKAPTTGSTTASISSAITTTTMHATTATTTPERYVTQINFLVNDNNGDTIRTGAALVPHAVKKRMIKELHDFAAETDPGLTEGIHIFPSESNILKWRAIIEGPDHSPFAGGAFVLSIEASERYPFSPPSIVFETPTVPYHCNVSARGNLCIDILRDSWSPNLTIAKVLHTIRNLLADPNPEDCLRHWIAELFLAHIKTNGKDSRYLDEARSHTQQYASKSVAELTRSWLSSNDETSAA